MSRVFFVFPQKSYADFEDFSQLSSALPIAVAFLHKIPGSIVLPGDCMLVKKN